VVSFLLLGVRVEKLGITGRGSKGEGARENKKFFSLCGKASSRKIGARASLAEKSLWTKAGPSHRSSG
jgi:hypothetical protein